MMKNFSRWIPVVVLGLAMAGCLRPDRGVYLSTQSISIAHRSPEADQLWEAVMDTLRRHRFRLDRVDRRAGVITTRPLTSQHLLEFWRHDVDNWQDLWESTLNPLRRRVQVNIEHDENGMWSLLAVTVHKERLSSPDRQFNSTGAAYRYFGYTLPSTTGKVRVTAKDDRWLDEGSDPAMEDYLLHKILARAGIDIESDNNNHPSPSQTP